jgi:D-alanine-D-alanine ligase
LDFIGSGSETSDLVMDKLKTKKRLKELGMPTAQDWVITRADLETPPADMTFPVVVKVPCEGSSVGIEKINDLDTWHAVLPTLLEQSPALLAEKFLVGRECTVPVVLGQAMTVVEIRPPAGFYDYDAKYIYANGHTEYFCPPVKITPDEQQMLQYYAVRFYHEFNCRDLVRVDFIIGEDGVPYILEGNSLPGFTSTSLVPKAAACMNISFERLCSSLVKAHRKETN